MSVPYVVLGVYCPWRFLKFTGDFNFVWISAAWILCVPSRHFASKRNLKQYGSLSFYFSKNERFYQRSNEIGLIFEKYFLIDHVSKSRKMRFPLALEWLTVSKSLRPSTNQHLVSLIAPISTQTIQFWSESLRFFSNWVKRENASGNAEIIFTLG